jgi:hypothetical protein
MADRVTGSIESQLRQQLHIATGDRDAEAKALVDRTDEEIDERDAREAVRRTHGDVEGGVPTGQHAESETATAKDAEEVHREHEERGEHHHRREPT